MINLAELIPDPDFAQPFIISRALGRYENGVYTEDGVTRETVIGIVTLPSPPGTAVPAAIVTVSAAYAIGLANVSSIAKTTINDKNRFMFFYSCF